MNYLEVDGFDKVRSTLITISSIAIDETIIDDSFILYYELV